MTFDFYFIKSQKRGGQMALIISVNKRREG